MSKRVEQCLAADEASRTVASRRRGMAMPSRLGIAIVMGVCAVLDAAAAADAPPGALAALLKSGAVTCRPAMPHFCSNIHVACAGPSSMRALPFTLKATRSAGAIDIAAADTAGLRELYADARVEWDADDDYVILRPRQASGYVKLLADGTYIVRHYTSPYAATMSRGQCQ